MEKNKKVKIIVISLVVAIVVALFVFLIYLYYGKVHHPHSVIFMLKGSNYLEVEYGDKYVEEDALVLVDNNDMSKLVKIDNKNLSINKLGEYKIRYYINFDNKVYEAYRKIKVVDNKAPEIKLNGPEKIELLQGEDYKDEGATAFDNYDGDITDKIKIEGKLDTSLAGQYTITYIVADSSGNTSSVDRIITVKVPNKIVTPNNEEDKETKKDFDPTQYSNTVTQSNFTSTGFSLAGYKAKNNGTYKLKLKGKKEYSFDLSSGDNGTYRGSIDLANLPNDTYKVYIDSETEEELLNKMAFISRLGRAKISNKLVSFIYDDDVVRIKIEDFAYQYDVLIDPGHGGIDPGASNEYIYEKEMNLLVSLYEKCRYEEHGYRVYMTRTTDVYGDGMGDDSLIKLHRRAYEMGYVGAVTKIVYSNHHNAIGYGNYMGYEILLPGYLTSSDLTSELAIVNKFNQIYPLTENHLRFYAKDYETEVKYSKLNGEVYSFKDNYAVNRIPYNLFHVKSLIYEAAYLTNKDDYNWYWNEKNWIKVSEAKIEVYIKYLGGSYNPDNSVCYSMVENM